MDISRSAFSDTSLGDLDVGTSWADDATGDVNDTGGAVDAFVVVTEPLPETVSPPQCGTDLPDVNRFIEAPDLAQKAHTFDRIFWVFNGRHHGLNADIRIRHPEAKAQILAFAEDPNLWSLDSTGMSADALVVSDEKVAGLYAGIGIAADAYRYGVLRDSAAPCEEIERARRMVQKSLEMLVVISEITGQPGIMPRGLARRDTPGAGQNAVIPLFDDSGQPLPEEKNNGTWRADQSGVHGDYIWEDSCSRDMYVGWVLAMASLWEVIGPDPHFSDMDKLYLRNQAHAMVTSLRQVGEEGFDLEIRDADGRRTYHGILNENSIDRQYIVGAPNGFNGLMAVGIVNALAYVSGRSDDRYFAENILLNERRLLGLAADTINLLDLGAYTNFSGYNMAFISAFLATRYIRQDAFRNDARGVTAQLYNTEGRTRQPVEQSQALYDIVYAAAMLGKSPFPTPPMNIDIEPIREKVTVILREFPAPPFFPEERINCDASEVLSLDCVAVDGTPLPLLGPVGWNDELVSAVPVPMRIRPPSNFYWRSNPYQVNGTGDPLQLLPANDFRFVYWFSQRLELD